MGGLIECPGCKKRLHSMYRHHFVGCGCPEETFVDGGFAYLRYGGKNIDKIEVIEHTHNENGSTKEVKCSS